MKNNEMYFAAIECLNADGEIEVGVNYQGFVIMATYKLENIEMGIRDNCFVLRGKNYDITVYPEEFRYDEEDNVWYNICQSIAFKRVN